MTHQEIITRTANFVQKTLENAEDGHDWWHIYRVWQTAKTIAQTPDTEGSLSEANLLVVELAALLHDIADSKFHNGDEEIGPKTARNFLNSLGIDVEIVNHVENIIRHISFKGGNFEKTFHSLELAIVQDADRLDAIGAIGIARTFNYGGFKNRPLHDPSVKPDLQMSKTAYKSNNAPTINHFYEKLLLLKHRMNTNAGKRMAAQRHEFMEDFLAQFYAEWEGIK